MLVLAIILALLGLTSPFIVKGIFGGSALSYDTLSNLGDWLGGTSAPLLNLAAFIMILAAYKSQQEELELTREEMKLTRQEFEEQNSTMKKQRFENTFFQIMSFRNEIVRSLRFTVTSTTYSGIETFLQMSFTLNNEHYNRVRFFRGIPHGELLDPEKEIRVMTEAYATFWLSHQGEIGHYFGNLTSILSFISSSFQEDVSEEGLVYANFLKSLISPRELIAIYYYIHFGPGYYNLFELTDRYNLFENMDEQILKKEHRIIEKSTLDGVRKK